MIFFSIIKKMKPFAILAGGVDKKRKKLFY